MYLEQTDRITLIVRHLCAGASRIQELKICQEPLLGGFIKLIVILYLQVKQRREILSYNSKSPISHVGIYAGDGMMIHAGNPIRFVSINTPYWIEHFYGFGRVK